MFYLKFNFKFSVNTSRIVLFALMILSAGAVNFVKAQKATLHGKIVDKASGETIIGAVVSLSENGQQVTGAVTDFDGNYSISCKPGNYTILVQYTGFAKIHVSDVKLTNGQRLVMDFDLEAESQNLEMVVVTEAAVRNTDASLISIQRKAFGIQDGVSSQQISRTGSSNAADAMKQMTGAVLEGNRFIVMRGLGDRYSLSQINGTPLPSSDPYRNSASLDLIPAQVIDNIITLKTFTPDLPGNFSGGLININTKSFPEKFTLNFQIGQEFNFQSSLRNDFLTQQGGKYDYLGFDDGSRKHLSYLQNTAVRDNLSSSTYLFARNPSSQYDEIRDIFNRSSKDFSKEFVPARGRSPMNTSINFNIGNQTKLFGRNLGYTFSINYSDNYQHIDNGVVNTYIYTNPSELFSYQNLKEVKSIRNPQLGSYANVSYKLNAFHNLGFNVIFNNDAEIVNRSQSGSFLGQVSESAAVFNTNSLEFTQRQFATYQLTGKHSFSSLNSTECEWNLSRTHSLQNEPDLRYMAFTALNEGETVYYNMNNAEFAFPYHFYRNLKDNGYTAKMDITVPILNNNKSSSSNKIKFGGFYNLNKRNFSEYRYQLNNTGVPANLGFNAFNGDWGRFFNPDNFGIIGEERDANGNISRYITGYHYINQVNNKNFYTGSEQITAAYGMLVYSLTNKLKAIGGVRLESTDLLVESQDTSAPIGKINLTDVLYSANLVYALSEKQNIRFAATQTLARPNMRELAPFEQFDTKNGFFNTGNPLLKRTLIQNLDLRYESYPRLGELIAVSVFYKNFMDPIIRAFNPRATIPEQSFINIDNANVYGVELEYRKSLDFLGSFFKYYALSTNFALIHSEYKIPQTEFNNSKTLNPNYNTSTRPFQGQAPYIANVILSYINPEKGWESTLSFNVTGRKLYNIALFATPDVYEQEVPLLNFKLSKRILRNYQLSLTARNILNPVNAKTQLFNGHEYISESFRTGTSLGLSLAYTIR